MIKYILKKLKHLLITLFGVSLLSFFLLRLIPGDPVMLLLGERGADPKIYKEMKVSLGLDKSIPVQYISFLKKAFQGDLGKSIISKQSVVQEFKDRFPATLELSMIAMIFALILGIPLGVIAAVKKNTWVDYVISSVSLIGYSMPIFWWALILMLIFSLNFMVTPVSGRISVLYDVDPWSGFLLIDTLTKESFSQYGFSAFWDAFRHLILPSFALGTIPLALISRMTRGSMLDVLNESYMRTAKSKGLSFYRIIFIHGLKNALIPIITVAGLIFGGLITGAILTETIFSWPGIGKWLVTSINARDYPVIQASTLFIATIIVLLNNFVDIMYAAINPKLRIK